MTHKKWSLTTIIDVDTKGSGTGSRSLPGRNREDVAEAN
jgi:hypothetical protein